jgi:hypothetical protein
MGVNSVTLVTFAEKNRQCAYNNRYSKAGALVGGMALEYD